MNKKLLLIFISIFISLSLLSCNEAEKLQMDISFETQNISLKDCSFKIPKAWNEFNISSTNTDTIYYAPSNADLSFGTSNVSISIHKSELQTTLSKIKSDKNNIKNNIITAFPTASNFKYNEFSVDAGDVFIVNYEASINETSVNNCQYYLLANDYNVVVTFSNFNDDINPTPKEVAEYILFTFKLK